MNLARGYGDDVKRASLIRFLKAAAKKKKQRRKKNQGAHTKPKTRKKRKHKKKKGAGTGTGAGAGEEDGGGGGSFTLALALLVPVAFVPSFCPPRFPMFYHISVYMMWFRFTCVFFHTNTVKYWKCCPN